jgi:NAD(P)-dependent dehydrogenase (short-subunit alcohol dehydrogenase family)
MRLQDRATIVTGAASGIGRAIATRFAAEGACVLATDRHAERLKENVAAIRRTGGRAVGVDADIADPSTAERLIDHTLEEFGRLDVLVNNAGVMDYMQGVAEVTDDVWRRVLSINLDAHMYTCRLAVRHMVAQGGGSILNVASAAGLGGGAAGVAYTAAKHGVVGLTRNIAWMYAKSGVRCNALCPGSTNTNIVETMPEDLLDPAGSARAFEWAALAPALLEPEQHAALAVFLASDESSGINGAIIPVDGGWTAA